MASQLVLTLAGERDDQYVRGRQRRHLGFGSVRRDERGREGGEAEHQQPGLPFSMLYGAEPRSLGLASSGSGTLPEVRGNRERTQSSFGRVHITVSGLSGQQFQQIDAWMGPGYNV